MKKKHDQMINAKNRCRSFFSQLHKFVVTDVCLFFHLLFDFSLGRTTLSWNFVIRLQHSLIDTRLTLSQQHSVTFNLAKIKYSQTKSFPQNPVKKFVLEKVDIKKLIDSWKLDHEGILVASASRSFCHEINNNSVKWM